MARYRIGNDMTIIWSITDREGKAFPLSGKQVHLYYTCERGRYEADIEIQDNVVSWDFLGSKQKVLGNYTLTLEIAQSDSKRTIRKDMCDAFTLVGKGCEEKYINGDAHINEGGELTLASELDIYRISPIIPYAVTHEDGITYWYVDGVNTGERVTGITAYEYAKSKGYEGTEEEFAQRLAEIPDWGSASRLDGGYIKNRTHGPGGRIKKVIGTLSDLMGGETKNYVTVLHYEYQDLLERHLYLNGIVVVPEVGKEYAVKYEGPAVYATIQEDGLGGYNVMLKGMSDTGAIIEISVVLINQLSDLYIPDTIARVEGDYPSLHVGTADDLAGRGESVPASFGFRASGGKSIKDGRAYIKRIKGNSVVWNQSTHIDGWFAYYSTLQKSNGVISWSPNNYDNGYWKIQHSIEGVQGHKYLVSFGLRLINGSTWRGREIFTGYFGTPTQWLSSPELVDNFLDEVAYRSYIVELATDKVELQIGAYGADDGALYDGYPSSIEVHNPMLIDLTKMFQAGNEPTIEEFNARVATLGIDMYAYNEGQVIHCNTESIKSVGDNAWDEQWRQGYYIEGTFRESSSQIASANPIKVLPNQEYYINQDTQFYWWFYDEDMQYVGYTYTFGGVFKVPANAKYMHFNGEPDYGTTYKNDIMIRLDHSGWKSDIGVGYEPYWQDTLPLPIINKYFPDGMMKAGTAHDEIRYNKASGKWEYSKGKIKNVDLGSLTWEKVWYSEAEAYRIFANITNKAAGLSNILCGAYTNANVGDGAMADKSITGNDNPDSQYIYIKDSSYSAEGADALIASLQGVMLYYESNDWEWVELDAEDQNFRDYYNVADFGTEMSQSNVPSAPFSADIIYQFNAVDMIREHEAEITELQKVIATMQAQLASLASVNDL